MKLRPAAVPLITADPYFSIWSCNNRLNEGYTKNWNGKANPIAVGIYVDSNFISMGMVDVDLRQAIKRIHQSSLDVTPLSTVYTFENKFAKITLTFTTPLLLNRLDILARPVSYVSYNIEKKCDAEIKFVFGISSRCCVNKPGQQVSFKKTPFSLCCGNTVQNPLSQSGDRISIDWGYLHLCDTNAYIGECIIDTGINRLMLNKCYDPYTEMPYMLVCKKELSGVITLAYDEIYPIEYFGKPLKEYYTEFFGSFEEMVSAAVNEYDEIKKMCDEFDKELLAESKKHSDVYSDIVTLAYRQAIAAHKLVCDENGDLLFLSKECDSCGCIGTLDVTYPSIPLFLKYNPELVLGMLRPIIKYAKSEEWPYDFAPHDVGFFPFANGQVYGANKLEMQMPVEESGNMFLCLAAVMKYSGGNKELFDCNKELMKQWVDYLVNHGYNPENQLCTDDFAGHLGHNCNLSLKAILAIAAYSQLSGDASYMDIAKKYAAEWEKDAQASHGATRLTFDNPDGWSMKYNMVWDNILEFNLFSEKVKKNEIRLYAEKMNRYGVPLDCREDYTKLDWLIWTTRIYDDKTYFNMVTESIANMINETSDRVPLQDWYQTKTAAYEEFFNRTVVGGLFINMI